MTYRQRNLGDERSSGDQRAGGSTAKITINLVPRALTSLDKASEITGHTKTECINRALQIYTWLLSRIASGDQFQVLDTEGRIREIQIF